MKHIKVFESIDNENKLKKNDYVIFVKNYTFLRKNYPYKINRVKPNMFNAEDDLTCFITNDNDDERTFNSNKYNIYKKISKEQADLIINANKYNL